MNKTKAARRCGNIDTRQNVHTHEDSSIISNFEFGSLLAGLIIAVSFGLMFVHASVVM